MAGIEISNEILSLMILTALTVIGYMIAVNSRGVTRMSLSYLLATLLLAVNIFSIAQYVNGENNEVLQQEYQARLAKEKAEMEKKLATNAVDAEALREQELKSDEALKLLAVTNEALALAEELSTMNLLDYTLTYDQKVSRAAKIKRTVQSVKNKYTTMQPDLAFIKDSSIAAAFEKLAKSALYCKLYYSAEDSDQEVVRERVMRTNAKKAKEMFQTANTKIEGMK